MSVFNKMLASVGIGSAKVDARLNNGTVRVGGSLEGEINIQGGSAEQHIDRIYLHLMTQYLKQQGDNTQRINHVIEKWEISQPLTIGPGEQVDIPFTLEVPLTTPVTLGKVPVWLKTGLDIDNAIDPKDTDQLEVLPHPHMQAVLNAVKHLGFRLKTSTCEYSTSKSRLEPFVQEIEFYPPESFGVSVRELELIFFLEPHRVEVLVEVDRKGSGVGGLLARAFDMDERKNFIRFSQEELERGREYIGKQLTAVIAQLAR
ncbi:sporulation protein [Hyalangium rubrum]|uniref:Sporulation protein n=1 Tax=Hyalangium rubrum TaxID=3103134 RepID=A0ABU5H095_9BACT|nr:sporulation protein [Hyalangium sp. s54d21]MDY7226736.1 sporulation protein [Hyalangium sp. s54d21]